MDRAWLKFGERELEDVAESVPRFGTETMSRIGEDRQLRLSVMKGFSLETSLDDIKEWLEGKGTVENVFMRKDAQRQFKGSIFAVFDTVEAAKNFVETPSLKYKDNDLLVLSKSDYYNMKAEEKKKLQLESKSKSNQAKDRQKKAEDAEMESLYEKTGCLLKFSGDLDDSTSRENLHELFDPHGEIKWIDFSRGAKNGIILFKGSAKEALEKAKEAHGGTLTLKNKETTWEIVEGDTEKEALKRIIEDQQESFKKKGRGRRSRGKGRRGGQPNKSQVTFQGKKTTFESEDESDEADSVSPKKRALEENEVEEPASKLQKTENESGNQ
ncbi:lupus La protein [Protopterus annectens]|uniref:lupus La protein n=1 Tax=Protopterus annectens TaxID=7888 RepID=UPI001CFBD8C0|nr:lupus La protein [Protopterus annectens]